MRNNSIYMQDWLKINHRTKVSLTDSWYLQLANRLLELITNSLLYKQQAPSEKIKAALSCAIYLQDTIGQNGGWKAFSERYYQLYHAYLPFYTLPRYIPDEINQEDVSFILWALLSEQDLSSPNQTEIAITDPLLPELLKLARHIYDEMDHSFEEAPISEVPSPSHWLAATQSLEANPTPLPETDLNHITNKDARKCLIYSKGEPLLYFASYNELTDFFIKTLGWENHPDSLFSELKDRQNFVIYANAKGMLLASDISFCFKDAGNPTYNQEKAISEGFKLFYIPGRCPFDLLKYGITNGLFPDIQFPYNNGKCILHQHWDFIARFYLGEYYEGD